MLHAYGAIRVLESLGPKSIMTDGHKQLLTTQSSLMVY